MSASLAHPLRIRILDELSAYGPLTASGLAERLGESSGVTSYHLRQLEKHELVREVKDRGTARERWWERRPGSIATPDARVFEPGSAERLATQLITNEWERGRQQNYHEFLVEGDRSVRPELAGDIGLPVFARERVPAQERAVHPHGERLGAVEPLPSDFIFVNTGLSCSLSRM